MSWLKTPSIITTYSVQIHKDNSAKNTQNTKKMHTSDVEIRQLEGFDWQNFIRTDRMSHSFLFILLYELTNFFVITENDWQVSKLFNISAHRTTKDSIRSITTYFHNMFFDRGCHSCVDI